jgi:hypothetical protein
MTYKWEAIAQDLTEENERLRKALEEIIAVGKFHSFSEDFSMLRLARAALKSEKQ